ncbi:MAG: hypothetical protein R3315_12805 [Woeseiaceae bacterium]|nr:hypothetical protein [Woeseiaceae bacterium]
MNRREVIAARMIAALTAVGLMCNSLPAAQAADEESRAGHGSYSITYQYIKVDGYEGLNGKSPIGEVYTHTLNFEIDYHITDRWTLVAGIPFVRERYEGDRPHDPLALDPPRPDVKNVDTGDWNQGFQDFHLGARYLARSGFLSIEPYVYLGIPSHDYEHFGHAAIGQNLWKVDVGSTFLYVPPISDAYYRLDLGYVFVEETLGTNIDHWLIRAEAGYAFSEKINGRVFSIFKNGNGLTSGPADFPSRTSPRWFQHDRMLKHNFTTAGVGLDFALSRRHQLSTAVLTMVQQEQVHILEYAFVLSFSQLF